MDISTYTTSNGTVIEPGMIVTDGHRRMHVERIEDCKLWTNLHGTLVVSKGTVPRVVGKKGAAMMPADELHRAGVFSAELYRKLGLTPPSDECMARYTRRPRRRRR